MIEINSVFREKEKPHVFIVKVLEFMGHCQKVMKYGL